MYATYIQESVADRKHLWRTEIIFPGVAVVNGSELLDVLLRSETEPCGRVVSAFNQ